MTMPVLMIVFLSLFQTLASLPSEQAKEKLKVYRLYDGPQRPPAEIAVLRAGKRWRSLYLLSVDGKKPLDGEKSYRKDFSIELLPGPHVLEVEVISSIPVHRSAKLVVPLRFTVEAGHQYVIAGGEIVRGQSIGGANTMTIYSGRWEASVADVTAGTVRRWSSDYPEGPVGEFIYKGDVCPAAYWLPLNNRDLLTCRCPTYDTTVGRVFGTDRYLIDSLICRAALHAGVINSEGGLVTVRLMPPMQSYQGSTRNGVTSENFVPEPRVRSYVFQAVVRGATPDPP